MGARKSVLLHLQLDNVIYVGKRDVLRFDFEHSRNLSILFQINPHETVEACGLPVHDTIAQVTRLVESIVLCIWRIV